MAERAEAAVSNVDVESDGHSGLIVLVAIIIGVGVWILRSGRCRWPPQPAKSHGHAAKPNALPPPTRLPPPTADASEGWRRLEDAVGRLDAKLNAAGISPSEPLRPPNAQRWICISAPVAEVGVLQQSASAHGRPPSSSMTKSQLHAQFDSLPPAKQAAFVKANGFGDWDAFNQWLATKYDADELAEFEFDGEAISIYRDFQNSLVKKKAGGDARRQRQSSSTDQRMRVMV